MSDSKSSPAHDHETITGTVTSVNFAPKGEVDGLLLDVGGKVVQLNLSPEHAVGAAALVGKSVEATVSPEPKVADHPKGDHPVHKLVSFAGGNGKLEPGHSLKPHEPGHGHPPEKPKHDEGGEAVEVSGKVARINFAKHGEANGVVLDGGDFLHLKPHGMKAAGLEVGHTVTAKGKSRPGATGNRAIDAETVNGAELPAKPAKA